MSEDGKKARGAIALILGFAFVLICVLLIFFEPSASTEKYLVLLIGALISLVTMVVQFYFGSSSGAKQLVAHQAEAAASLAKKVVPLVGALPESGPVPTGTPDDPVTVTVAEDDPGHASFKELAKQLNPDATDEQMASAWASLKASRVDVDPTEKFYGSKGPVAPRTHL